MSVYRATFHNYEWSDKVFPKFDDAVKYCEHIKKDYNISSIIVEEKTIWSSDTLDELLKDYKDFGYHTKDEVIAEIDRVFGTPDQGC